MNTSKQSMMQAQWAKSLQKESGNVFLKVALSVQNTRSGTSLAYITLMTLLNSLEMVETLISNM